MHNKEERQPFEREPHTLESFIDAFIPYHKRFTPAELNFMEHFRGCKYDRKDTAYAMCISLATVDNYIKRLKGKINHSGL